jgi:hypothetical protein
MFLKFLVYIYKRKQALAQTTGSGQTCNGKIETRIISYYVA